MTLRLSPYEQTTLAAFAAVVRRRFGARLAALELFGSRARGEGRDDSDLDLLVSIRGLSRSERNQVIDDAADLTLETGLVLSPLVVDSDAFGPDLPLAKEIARDGVSL
jgi:predicted nucleotidyltransferase